MKSFLSSFLLGSLILGSIVLSACEQAPSEEEDHSLIDMYNADDDDSSTADDDDDFEMLDEDEIPTSVGPTEIPDVLTPSR